MSPASYAFLENPPNWEQIKAVVFDLGNVLLDLDNEHYDRSWPHAWAAENAELANWLKKTQLFYKHETGQIGRAAFVEAVSNQAQLSPKQVEDYWNSILVGIKPEIYKLLSTLQQHFDLYVLSNTNETHIHWVRQYLAAHNQADFETRYFKHVGLSYELGAVKPEPEIYQRMDAHIPHRGDTVLFIDDKPENISAAIAYGWQGIHLPVGTSVLEVFPSTWTGQKTN